jgi:hypothetical protein
MTAASVLPEPVGATSKLFTFLAMTGKAFRCIAVNLENPSFVNFSTMSLSLPLVVAVCSCGLLLAGLGTCSFINHYCKQADYKQSYCDADIGIKVCYRFAYHAH